MNQKLVFPSLFIFLIVTVANAIPTAFSASTTVVSPTPQYAYGSMVETLTVNISIQDVINLGSWQLSLSYNPHIINCTEVFIPYDNIFSGYTTTFGYNIDNRNGSLEAFNGIWTSPGPSGSGKLCSITFQPLTPGISALSFLSGTYLRDPNNNPIPFETEDGTIQINGDGFNLYTFNVQNGGVNYNITIFSNSTITSFQFNYTDQKIVFYASGPTGTAGSCTVIIPVPLLNGTFGVLVDGSSRHHSISVGSSNQYLFFHYQHITADPREVQVLTTITGDLNGDRKVDMRDVAAAARAFGTTPGDARWDARADITGPDGYPDGKVDMRDIALVARSFGDEWSPS